MCKFTYYFHKNEHSCFLNLHFVANLTLILLNRSITGDKSE